jgi:ABC-2 type transport system permease protein
MNAFACTLAIARRELASYFRVPLGWVVIALFTLLTGVIFAITLEPGAPATLRSFFGLATWSMLFVAPAVSMRLLSEETRGSTIEILATSPVTSLAIVAGKYLGASGFLLAMLAPTLVYVGALEAVANPDYGPILTGYLGLLLAGMTYLAVGLLASTLTASQTSAFLGALFALLLLRLGTTQAARLPEPWSDIVFALSLDLRIDDFAKGVADLAGVVFFLAASVWFVSLAAVALEARRWR